MLGQEVATLVGETLDGGDQIAVWKGRDARGQLVGSGMYFYRIESEGRAEAEA